MNEIIKHAHSGLRWLVLILILAAIVNAFMKWKSGDSYEEKDKNLDKWALLIVHIQLVIGFVVYFTSSKVVFEGASMKDAINRFFLVEHLAMMIIAAVIITIGHVKKKRKVEAISKFKTVFWYYLVSLVIILAAIPWPFQKYGGSWF